VSLYVDGVLDASSPATGLIQANDAAVVIGGNSEVSNREWNGLIDEVCILGCAMSANEIAALHSGQDVTAIAEQIGDRPPAVARIEPSSGPIVTEDVSVPVPERAQNKSGLWLRLLVALAGAGLVVSAYASRLRSPAHQGVSERQDIGGPLRHLTHGVPGMTWKIARKEFLLSLMTFKFAVGTTVCVVLMVVFMPGLVNDYEERLANYNGNVAANEAEFQKVRVYNNLTPTVYRAPTVLSVFSKGIVNRLENSERIDLDEVSGTETGVGEANTLLSVFPTMDVTLILKIVISVLALLMAYDVVSSEREQGTLRLILSNRAPRPQILLGKLVAGWMTLAVTVTAAFIFGLLILLMSKAASPTGADWFRILLMYLVSLIFVASMFNLGLLLSSMSRSSAVSLVLVLFLWLVFAAILPNASAHLAAQLRPIESPEQFAAKLKAITNQRDQEIADLTRDIHEGEGSRSDGAGAFGNGLIVFANKAFMDYLKQTYPITEPHKIQCIDKLLDVKAEYLGSLVRQKQLADTLAGVTPIVLCERLMSTLAGTDFDNFRSFKNRVRAYRHEVADYIRDRTDNFAATIYFTPSHEGDQERFFETFFKPYDETQDKALKARLYETAMQEYQQMEKEMPTLDLDDFPQFTYWSQPITTTLQQAIPAVGLLVFQGALFFALSFVAFLRYDVR
jgi:ABC-type transport system involved in multi-copper enzyme maturation permease subunit